MGGHFAWNRFPAHDGKRLLGFTPNGVGEHSPGQDSEAVAAPGRDRRRFCTLKECDNHSSHCRTLSGCMCPPCVTRGGACGLPRAMVSHPIRGENPEIPAPVRGRCGVFLFRLTGYTHLVNRHFRGSSSGRFAIRIRAMLSTCAPWIRFGSFALSKVSLCVWCVRRYSSMSCRHAKPGTPTAWNDR